MKIVIHENCDFSPSTWRMAELLLPPPVACKRRGKRPAIAEIDFSDHEKIMTAAITHPINLLWGIHPVHEAFTTTRKKKNLKPNIGRQHKPSRARCNRADKAEPSTTARISAAGGKVSTGESFASNLQPLTKLKSFSTRRH